MKAIPSRMQTVLEGLLYGVLMGLIYPLAVFVLNTDVAVSEMGRDWLIGTVYATCIGTPARFVMPYVGTQSTRMRKPLNWILVLSSLLVIAFVGCVLACSFLVLIGVFPFRYFWLSFIIGLRVSIVITILFGVSSYLIHFLRWQLQEATLKLRTRELERERTEKLASEAKLLSLESRIHPHFLFNTINSISALIREDPARAEKMLEQMAALLRFSLETHRRLVPLSQEAKIASDYLEIERARFGQRIRYSLDVRAELNDQQVPPLAVQTLLENSVKYAVSPRREGANIRLRAWRENGSAHIAVWDDGPGFTAEQITPGHGLDNLAARLEMLFPHGASLAVSAHDGGTEVVLSLPSEGAA